MADFLLGLPETSTRLRSPRNNYLFYTSLALFIQDDYKVTRRFTLNLGLRYDLLVPPEQARRFTQALRGASHAPVVHVELPGAIHAFDVFRSWRTGLVVQAAYAFAQRSLAQG